MLRLRLLHLLIAVAMNGQKLALTQSSTWGVLMVQKEQEPLVIVYQEATGVSLIPVAVQLR